MLRLLPRPADHRDTVCAVHARLVHIRCRESADGENGDGQVGHQFREACPAQRRFTRMAGAGFYVAEHGIIEAQAGGVFEFLARVAGSAEPFSFREGGEAEQIVCGEMDAVGVYASHRRVAAAEQAQGFGCLATGADGTREAGDGVARHAGFADLYHAQTIAQRVVERFHLCGNAR